ncbi:hypothetical protein P1X15_04180 [Runella sp. MFBS21]|uniref:hypothetical protein n=1 Tax=Runella sp. MFBS21 TaxID=3034018 RepID=UPI0023F89268|nr:hypothetical protein [Runella sp. MFBS21]MDF7816776.1 hypothetical protein [Runella sp. MFBS21]
MLSSAHQGYIYQDILGAYFVAQEIALGRGSTTFVFDQKKTPLGVPDKFDDLTIYREETTIYLQVKYSNEENRHALTKQDFSAGSSYDLALFDLFKTWNALHKPGTVWKVGLAWDEPIPDDPIYKVLIHLSNYESLLPGTTCYQFDCEVLWPEEGEVLSSWSALKKESKSIDRKLFKSFLDCLIIEVGLPKSSLLQDYTYGLENLLARTIEMIGIGIYPNDHLSVRDTAERICSIVRTKRSTENSGRISCDEIAKKVDIIQSYGGFEQKFPIDETLLVTTPERVNQVIKALEDHRSVVLTAEPGAGKSWFIENLEKHLTDTTQIIKHYCYTALEDPLSLKRITVNVLYGNLITQLIKSDEGLIGVKAKRYASNLEELNLLLKNIEKKTLLIIDGIDHIWRVYQKNRGGITEDETTILKALSQLDCSNPNISILVVSQPIEQLSTLTPFYPCTLAPLPESFVITLLEKYAIPNSVINKVSLSTIIYQKSNGNALYCKYLIEHALSNKANYSFEWIHSLPPYQYNLTGYYQYLYEQIHGDSGVPYALCGADFSLTEDELKQITYLGNSVTGQLNTLRPVLKFKTAYGYSIYHESFKRFVIDRIKSSGASIEHLIYQPLIKWLETHSFFESTKAYGHLLKLYYEVDFYDKIAKTIAIDFVDNSLYYAQPFHTIFQNQRLQKAALAYVDGFAPLIIIAEQSKIIYELEHISGNTLINYLKATQRIHGDEFMERVLWDGERLLIAQKEALHFLTERAYAGEPVIHWSIITFPLGISYDLLGLVAIKHLHTRQYDKFDEMIKKVYENPNYRTAFNNILNETEWWTIHFGDGWIANTTYFQSILAAYKPSVSTIGQAVERIISNERFAFDDNWQGMVRDLVAVTKTATQEELEGAIRSLSHYNWFRNWLIYLIKVTELSQRNHRSEELIEAFTYLVRDLDPFKGEPRVCDLYSQLSFIKKSFHQGLLLCKADEQRLLSCCQLLEKVTEVTTSLQGSYSGPLTDEEYLELIANYLSGGYVIAKYEEYFAPLGSRKYYSDVAEIAFEYAYILSKSGRVEEAKAKYKEGIEALTAYGYRKDRTLSEILDCSVPYQQSYGTLTIDWFYELYHMAMTVVTHTDGRSTSGYPVEWFEEFTKVYPNEALRFLVSETLENSASCWHQEEEFLHILEEYPSLFTPTQWFLLCRSLPFASSDTLVSHGLLFSDRIDSQLQVVYRRWLQTLPYTLYKNEESTYPAEIVTQYDQQFGITLQLKEEKEKSNDIPEETTACTFSATSIEEVLAFLENNKLQSPHKQAVIDLISSSTDWDKKKSLLRQVARSFRYENEADKWAEHFLQPKQVEWLYWNIYLFIFLTDGWSGLHYTKYLKRAYEDNPSQTLLILKEILADLLADEKYPGRISCNLIKALCELQVAESLVRDLLHITFQIVKRRLPHPPNSAINESIYQGLEGFSRDEIVVALLIARLKTLTTEKTQGILWSLTYLAQTKPETLIKPYSWVFSNSTFLLPIHRAVLLQILKEYVDPTLLPDNLIGQFFKLYPTGFFLEDQYIRSFVNYAIELDETAAIRIQHESSLYDDGFFLHIHPKYISIHKHLGTLTGTYNAYARKRDEIIKKHKSYYIRTEEIITPIVPLANATYEILNSQFYLELKDLTYYIHPAYICNLDFFLPEIILQVGSLARRPSWIPTPTNFPSFEIRNTDSAFGNESWLLLALKEKELYGESFKPKQTRHSFVMLTIGDKSKPSEGLYAKYLFRVNQYSEREIENASFDSPICRLDIWDTLERSNILFVSAYIIKSLGLTIKSDFHAGLQAINSSGEIIIKMINWKEAYYGSISDGTEVPSLEGVAVVIRQDYYQRLLALYHNKSWFLLQQKENIDD